LSLFQMDEDLVACMIDDLKHVRLVLSASGDTEVEALHKAFPEYIKMALFNELYWIGITFDRPQQYYQVLCEAKNGRKVKEIVHSFEELEQFTIEFIKNESR
jgi:hypothetical protein